MFVGIDLALRKTGVVILKKNGTLDKFYVVSSDPKKVTGEELLVHNREAIKLTLPSKCKEDIHIALEGLSFGSTSADIDMISANHWITRMTLRDHGFKAVVFPPKAWMKHIITKEWLLTLAAEFPIVRAKKGLKHTKEQKAANAKSKLAIRNLSKQRILDSLPKTVLTKFEDYVKENKLPKDAIYDLSDAYCLAQHLKTTLEK